MAQPCRTAVSITAEEFLPEDSVRGIVKFTAGDSSELWCIEILGYEQVEWTETMTFVVQGFVQTYVEKASGNSRIFHSTVIVTKPERVSPRSTYEVPFNFSFPAAIPGSAPCIHYRVSAFIANPDHKPVEGQVSHTSLKVTQETPIKKPYCLKTESTVNFMMCCNRGQIRCKIFPDKPWYSPGEEVKLSCQFQNRSKGEITSIKVSLIHVKKLVSDDSIVKTDERMKLQEDLTTFTPTFSLRLPENLESSVFGKNYAIYYVLDVHVNVSRGNGPTFRLPIIIVPKRRESSLNDQEPISSGSSEKLPILNISIPAPNHTSSFSLKSFPNVIPLDELQRSSSRLSQGWSMVKDAIKSGSKIFSSRK